MTRAADSGGADNRFETGPQRFDHIAKEYADACDTIDNWCDDDGAWLLNEIVRLRARERELVAALADACKATDAPHPRKE